MTDLAQRAPIRPSMARTVVPGAAMIAVGFGLARYGYGLLLPEMSLDLSLSPSTAGLISSGTYMSYLVANVAVVAITTRWGPRAAVLLASATATVGMAVMALADSALVLAAGVLIAGAAAGLAYPPYAELVAVEVPARRRDVAWSAISSGTGWGVALAGPIAIAAGDHWRTAWMGFVALAVVVGVVAARLAPAHIVAGSRPRRPQLSWTWFLCPRSRPLLISAVLIGAGSAVWWSFSVATLRDAGIDSTSSRIIYAVCGAAAVLASVSGAVFSKVGIRSGYLFSAVSLAASLALVSAAAGVRTWAMAAAVAFGVSYNGVIAAQGIWSSRVFADHPAAGLAAINTALTIGTLVGPAAAGVVIAQSGFKVAMLLACLVIVGALPFCPPGARRRGLLARHRCTAARVRG